MMSRACPLSPRVGADVELAGAELRVLCGKQLGTIARGGYSHPASSGGAGDLPAHPRVGAGVELAGAIARIEPLSSKQLGSVARRGHRVPLPYALQVNTQLPHIWCTESRSDCRGY